MDGEKIQKLLKQGATIKIINCADKKHEKSVLQFRIYTSENSFYPITKFQAIKHLNKDQKTALKIYEDVNKNIIKAPFNVRLNWNIEIQQAKEKNSLTTEQIQKMVIHEAIKQKQYLELI